MPSAELLLIIILSFLSWACHLECSPTKTLMHRNNLRGSICQTEACHDLAQIYLENMDLTVDPCKDFYKFACGSAQKIRNRPKSRRFAVHPYIDADDATRLDLANLIDPSGKFPTDTQNLAIMRKFYESCNDRAKILSLKTEPLLKLIKQLGGFPLMSLESGWIDGKTFEWIDFLTKLRNLGADFSYLFKLRVAPDILNNSRQLIYLQQPDLTPDEIRQLNYGSSKYKETFMEILSKLGSRDFHSTEGRLQISAAADLLGKLYSKYEISEERDDWISSLERMTVEQLSLLAPNTDWLRLLRELIPSNIDEKVEIGIMNIQYFLELDKQLFTANQTDLANLLILRLAFHAGPLLPSTYEMYHGDKPWPDRCLDFMKELGAISLSTEYVRKFSSEENRARVLNMVQLIKKEMVSMIQESSWLEQKSKDLASYKCQAIFEYVSHTEALKNGTIIDKIYEGLDDELDASDFFMNAIKLQRRLIDRLLGSYDRHNSSPDDWLPHSMTTTANAVYQVQRNSINMLAAILRGTFYNESVPNYLNFGALGSIIGHEVTHAFDTQGVKFDKVGNFNLDWWDSEALKDHSERTKCFVDQYDGRKITDTYRYINGTKTLNENIADTVGYELSARAYEAWKKLNQIDEEPSLPLGNLSTDMNQAKLFWVAAASNSCNNMSPTEISELAAYDEHSPAEFRVNIAMSNVPKFAEDFRCPIGSPMNPEKKCRLW